MIDVVTFGKYFLILVSHPEKWIRRQVEAVHNRSRDVQEIKYSFDIDFSFVMKTAEDSGLPLDGWIPLPVLALEKGAIVDIDVYDRSGKSLNVVRRSENAFLSHCAWLASELDAGVRLTPEHFEMYAKCFSPKYPVDPNDFKVVRDSSGSLLPNTSSFDLVVWASILEMAKQQEQHRGNLTHLGLLKLRHRVASTNENGTIWQGGHVWPFLKQKWPLSERSIRLQSHMRFDVPDGLIPYHLERIFEVGTIRNQVRSVFNRGRAPLETEEHNITSGLVTVMLSHSYMNDSPKVQIPSLYARSLLSIRMRISSVWLLNLFLPSALTTGLLFVFGWFESSSFGLSRQQIPVYSPNGSEIMPGDDPTFIAQLSSSGGTLALMTLAAMIPTVWGLYASKPGEHFTFLSVVRPYRIALIVSSVSLLSFAIFLSFQPPHQLIVDSSRICMAVSGLSSSYLLLACCASAFVAIYWKKKRK